MNKDEKEIRDNLKILLDAQDPETQVEYLINILTYPSYLKKIKQPLLEIIEGEKNAMKQFNELLKELGNSN